MYSAADLTAALRRHDGLRPGLPPPVPTRLGAFRALWRQRWDPPFRDERRARAVSATASAFLHVLFAVALVWLLATGFVPEVTEPATGGDTVTEVEFIDAVEPPDAVGTPPPPSEDTQAPVASVPPSLPASPVAVPASPRPAPVDPAAAPVATAQPLQVTEVPAPDTTFVLPPPRMAEAATPVLRVTEVGLRQRAVPVLQPAPALRPLVAVRPVPSPSIDPIVPALVVRDIPSPLPVPELRAPAPATVPTVRLPSPDVRPLTRALPMPPTPVQAAMPAAPNAAVEPAPPSPASTIARAEPAATAPVSPSTSTSQAPPSSAPSAAAPINTAPGQPATGRPATARADDWGDAQRSAPGGGGAPGLYNPDRSPRLADGGRVGGGLPPGTITEDYEKIDRMGTWLKRPPVGYEPTAFDRLWVPHETLLQEWVRRSIKEVLIPIPGTSKRIRCSVALLALGGACGLSDANLQDVEAGARPPPDVPFRPDLQEDQNSLRKPK